MAIGIDTTKWKPRKIKGTPAAKFRNALAIGTITIGIAFGLLFTYIPVTKNLRKAAEALYEDPIEEVERKQMIASGLLNRTGATIKKIVEESERPDRPDK
ncbi:uncharacterized protein LOC128200728 [Galleria mellonella]|uniref:Uncharacterized protein LOC128200728 n=1 Tax=Galleria mellonella TaxID=7137 RepID=A0ABM3MIG4_GALME|nr:uncharacterized protein LOC128200728 [Galleria mellonella]